MDSIPDIADNRSIKSFHYSVDSHLVSYYDKLGKSRTWELNN